MKSQQENADHRIKEKRSIMYDRYQSPLSERYASKEMQYIFSPEKKFPTWRTKMIAHAEKDKELGITNND